MTLDEIRRAVDKTETDFANRFNHAEKNPFTKEEMKYIHECFTGMVTGHGSQTDDDLDRSIMRKSK